MKTRMSPKFDICLAMMKQSSAAMKTPPSLKIDICLTVDEKNCFHGLRSQSPEAVSTAVAIPSGLKRYQPL